MYQASEKVFAWMLENYRRTLLWTLDNSGLMLAVCCLRLRST